MAERTSLSVESESRVSTTFAQILRSTALIGFSSILVMAMSAVRMKTVALLVGPSGVGIMGVYVAILEVSVAVAGMGVASSGVRQVAEADAGGSTISLVTTVSTLRRLSILLGLGGCAVLAAVSLPVSVASFGDASHAAAIAIVGLAVLFRVVQGGDLAVVQGMRRIRALAQINVVGAALGTAVAIAIVLWQGEGGLALSVAALTGGTCAAAWWYVRDRGPHLVPVASPEARDVAGSLVRLGSVFMASAVMMMGSAYLVRIIVLKEAGEEAAGFYQAAWATGAMYTALVLQAMSADFYPRLTAQARDDVACTRLANEQAQISMLISAPGVIATIALAPLVMTVLYSSEFVGAVTLMRWICLGMMLRVMAWPLGFIVVARGARRVFLWTEMAATAAHLGSVALLVPVMGVEGAGAAFLLLYVWHTGIIYLVVRRMCGFRWSRSNVRLGLAAMGGTTAAFAACALLPPLLASMTGLALAAVFGLASLKILARLLEPKDLPAAIPVWLHQFVGRARVQD